MRDVRLESEEYYQSEVRRVGDHLFDRPIVGQIPRFRLIVPLFIFNTL